MAEPVDELIERLAATLQPLPAVDPAAKARLLVAVAAERQRLRETIVPDESIPPRRVGRVAGTRRTAWIGGLAGAAAAAAVLALWSGTIATDESAPAPPVAVASGETGTTGTIGASAVDSPAPLAGAPVRPASGASSDAALQPVQLVLRAPEARSVRVVGDFNGWDGSSSGMTRDPASGLWSTTVALRPGRHVYAFLVDDTLWMRDPRAAPAPDADFGRPGSVLLVGRP